jgi:hypothetical protein
VCGEGGGFARCAPWTHTQNRGRTLQAAPLVVGRAGSHFFLAGGIADAITAGARSHTRCMPSAASTAAVDFLSTSSATQHSRIVGGDAGRLQDGDPIPPRGHRLAMPKCLLQQGN